MAIQRSSRARRSRDGRTVIAAARDLGTGNSRAGIVISLSRLPEHQPTYTKHEKSPARGPGSRLLPGRAELLLLAGCLVGARLRIGLTLLRRRLRGCGLDLGVGRDGLLVFVAHVMNPFMKRPKIFSGTSSTWVRKSEETR